MITNYTCPSLRCCLQLAAIIYLISVHACMYLKHHSLTLFVCLCVNLADVFQQSGFTASLIYFVDIRWHIDQIIIVIMHTYSAQVVV